MRNKDIADKRAATRAIRSGQSRTHEREHNDPLFLTSSFVFENAAHAAGVFRGEEDGNVYSRFTNPTVNAFEKRLASLEGVHYAIGTASGMGAITLLALALLQQGDHVILGRNVFGSTLTLINKIFSRFGILVSVVDCSDVELIADAIEDNTRLLLVETPSNPLGEIVDIAAVSSLTQARDIIFVVDNCVCTPALMQAAALGADIVMHSTTKYIDGQGRCVGGALVTDNKEIYETLFATQRSAGISLSPFNAWVNLGGLETLALRMREHSKSAMHIAQWLVKQPSITKVHYAGLPDHPGHTVAARQQSDFGPIIAFEVAGGEAEAWAVIDATKWLSITANFGDAQSTITHPASTTHGKLAKEDRANMGIKSNLIRLSVGLEDVDDIIDDLSTGLSALAAL